MQVRFKPWGNGLGLRFSRELLASAGIKPYDVLTVRVKDGHIILSKCFQHRTLQQRAAIFGGQLHLSEEVDWDAPLGNEVW